MKLTFIHSILALTPLVASAPTSRFSILALNTGSNIHYTSPGIAPDNQLSIAAGAPPFIGEFLPNGTVVFEKPRHYQQKLNFTAAAQNAPLYLAISPDHKVVLSESPHTWGIVKISPLPLNQSSTQQQQPEFPPILTYAADGAYIAVQRKSGGYNLFTSDYQPPHGLSVVPITLTINWLNITASRIA